MAAMDINTSLCPQIFTSVTEVTSRGLPSQLLGRLRRFPGSVSVSLGPVIVIPEVVTLLGSTSTFQHGRNGSTMHLALAFTQYL